MLVLYMGTFFPSSTCRTGRPAAVNASSKEKEQPSKKHTMSSPHSPRISPTCPATDRHTAEVEIYSHVESIYS